MSVAERDGTLGERGDIRFVRDEHDRNAALVVEFAEELHHVVGRTHVERARWFVGEDEPRAARAPSPSITERPGA